MRQIAIFYHTDPLGHVPGGIDSIIRGVLDWAPDDLQYTLFGATSDPTARPVGREIAASPGNAKARFLPLVTLNAQARRAHVPVTVRYMLALSRYIRQGRLRHFTALDFHRIEPLLLFYRDRRPKNIIIHQDMTILRDPACDIMWRHAPWLYERLEPALLRTTSHIFTVRQSAAERYRELYPAPSGRVSFLPTWFDSRVFYPPANPGAQAAARSAFLTSHGIAPDATVLVTVGRLDKQKDPLLLLCAMGEALRTVPNLHLLFVGDGVLRGEIERAIATSGIAGRVTLLGVLPPVRIAEVLRCCDLFVLSSAYEGMPIAVLEALATGLPVVSTQVGEVHRVVQPGVSGYLCAQRTAASLSLAIVAAVTDLPFMRGARAAAAVAQFRPEAVLTAVYANHRAQTSTAVP